MAAAAAPPQPQQPFAQTVQHLVDASADPLFNVTARRDPMMAGMVTNNLSGFSFYMPPDPPAFGFSCADKVIAFAAALEKVTYIIPLPTRNRSPWRIREKLQRIAKGNSCLSEFPIVQFSHYNGEFGQDWYWRPLDPVSEVPRPDCFFIACFTAGPGMPVPHATIGRGTFNILHLFRGAVWESPVPPPRNDMHWRNSTGDISVPGLQYTGCECRIDEICVHEHGRTVVQFLVPPREACYQAILRNYSPFGIGLMSLCRGTQGYYVKFSSPVGEHALPAAQTDLPHTNTTIGPPSFVGEIRAPRAEFALVRYPRSLNLFERIIYSVKKLYAPALTLVYRVWKQIIPFTVCWDALPYPSRLSEFSEGLHTDEIFGELCATLTYRIHSFCAKLFLVASPFLIWRVCDLMYRHRFRSCVEVTNSSAMVFATRPPPGVPTTSQAFVEWRSRVNNMGEFREKTAVKDTWRRAVQTKHEFGMITADASTLELMWQSAANVEMQAPEFDQAVFPLHQLPPGCMCIFTHDHHSNVRHHICKGCRRAFRKKIETFRALLRYDNLLVRPTGRSDLGYLPLYSTNIDVTPFSEFTFDPEFRFGCVEGRKVVMYDPTTPGGSCKLKQLLETLQSDESMRGLCCGPFIKGFHARCYPRGPRTLLMAFCCRMGKARKHVPKPGLYNQLIPIYLTLILRFALGALVPESRAEWFSHFTQKEKREKMEQAQREIQTGREELKVLRAGVLKSKCFAKMEKSHDVEFDPETMLVFDKQEMKPRVIISPHPHYLYRVGPYAHRLTKFLSEVCDGSNGLFYAGCADPPALRRWLNKIVARFGLNAMEPPPNVYVGESDVTNMDSNYHSDTFDFHAVCRRLAFGSNLPADDDALFEQQRTIDAWGAFLHFIVECVLPSGVPDTSEKHSRLNILVTLYSISYAADPQLNVQARLVHVVEYVIECVEIGVAGDDSVFFSDLNAFGAAGREEAFAQLYIESWADFGFPLKYKSFVGYDWLKCTFLAMRPIWTSEGYAWAVEPGRRMKTMFWQLDCTIHPLAWARAVAVQNKNMGHVIPVFDDVVQFVLSFTGPTARPWVQPGYVWQDYVIPGHRVDRTYIEFFRTYDISPEMYADFRRWFKSITDRALTPVVMLDHPVFDQILSLC